MSETTNKRQVWAVCGLLAATVLVIYSQTATCEFIRFDDFDYIVTNDAIQHGLNFKSIAWAFTTTHAANWHPLTWLSHILDFQLYGLNPAGHRLTSIILHAANSVLLFLLLRSLTGSLWRSAAVATLFALHPLRVESVVWISERKDVLSTFFWMLTVWAYAAYARELKSQGPRLKYFYMAALACFALGLMAKPMVVTLPFVLLLLDYWPLGRWGGANQIRLLVLEKIPFFILSALACLVTFLAQQGGGAVISLAHVPLSARLANIPVSYVRYLGKLFWPLDLAVFYSYPLHLPPWKIMGAIILLAVLTALTVWRARKQPYLMVGWFWFLGMLAPMIGLVQAGNQAMADRFTYLGCVGVLIAVVWGLHELCGTRWRRVWGGLVGAAIVGCVVLTPLQAGYWKDSLTLFLHAATVSDENYIAYYNLGSFAAEKGKWDAALEFYRLAVEYNPNYAHAENNYGKVLFDKGRVDEALPHLEKAVQLNPAMAEGHYNLGQALLKKGRTPEALDQFQRGVDLQPNDPVAQNNLGSALLQQGLVDDAIPYLDKALRLRPDFAEPYYKLGNAFLAKNQAAEAIAYFDKAVALRPDYVPACNNLAWVLATTPDSSLRNGAKAIVLARRAEEQTRGTSPRVIATLAAAYAEARQFPEAIRNAQRALSLANAQTNSVLSKRIQLDLTQYRSGLPIRDVPQTVKGGASGQ